MRLPTRLLRRKADSNKGDYGHIFILAGSRRYSGAAVLCAEAAMRSGAGLVTLGIPKGINNAVIKIKPREAMTLPLPETKEGTLHSSGYKEIEKFIKKIDALVIGPGLTLNKSTQDLAFSIMLRAEKPIVVDADAINAVAWDLNMLFLFRGLSGAERILTPHPGEMGRLLKISAAEVQNNRKKIAREFSNCYPVTLVLKGHQTIVAKQEHKLYTNKTGNPGMSTAGSGDVLAGMIAAFLGQGLDAFNAAKYGVYLHGLAGDIAAKEKTQISLIASDIIAKIPEAIKRSS